MTKRHGFTILETLIALAIFLVLIGMVFQTTVRFMQVRAEQDAVTTAQSKLRRIVEVFTQDLRSAVLGTIIDLPYDSGDEAVSFALISGGAYNTLRYNTSDYFVDVASLNAPDFSGAGYALMVNNTGTAVIFRVTSVQPVATGRWRVNHAGCQNTVGYTINTLLFPVKPLGLVYDSDQQELQMNEGSGPLPYAFNITEFKIDYVYFDNQTGTDVLNPTGFNPTNSPPLKQFGGSSGNRYTLRRLRITLGTSEQTARGKTITRELVSNVDLSNNATYQIQGVVPCN